MARPSSETENAHPLSMYAFSRLLVLLVILATKTELLVIPWRSNHVLGGWCHTCHDVCYYGHLFVFTVFCSQSLLWAPSCHGFLNPSVMDPSFSVCTCIWIYSSFMVCMCAYWICLCSYGIYHCVAVQPIKEEVIFPADLCIWFWPSWIAVHPLAQSKSLRNSWELQNTPNALHYFDACCMQREEVVCGKRLCVTVGRRSWSRRSLARKVWTPPRLNP